MAQAFFVLNEVLWFSVFLLVLWYSVRRQGFKQSAIFFLPAVVWGILLEYATQEIFHRYYYGSGFLVYVANVPLTISLAWVALMYISYTVVTLKVQLKNSFAVAAVASVPLLLIDFFVLEPTAKIFGLWTWTPPSIWFGSPVGNVYGWFWVIVLYLSFYHFLCGKTSDWRKGLPLNLGLIVLRLAILIALLQLWKVTLGGL